METIDSLKPDKVRAQQLLLSKNFGCYSSENSVIEAETTGCLTEGIYPFAYHATSKYQNKETMSLIYSSKGELKEGWVNKIFARSLATKKYVITTFTEDDAKNLGTNQGELLCVILPELQKLFPFIHMEINDNTDSNGTIFFTARVM